MKKLGTLAAASAVAITTAWTAEADEDHGTSFPVTHQCAESALRNAFEIGAKDIVVATPDGVAVSRYLAFPESGSEGILRGQVNLSEGYVTGTKTETEITNTAKGTDLQGSFLRSYGVESKPSESITSGSNVVDNISKALSDRVDRALRECSQPQFLSGLVKPAPFVG